MTGGLLTVACERNRRRLIRPSLADLYRRQMKCVLTNSMDILRPFLRMRRIIEWLLRGPDKAFESRSNAAKSEHEHVRSSVSATSAAAAIADGIDGKHGFRYAQTTSTKPHGHTHAAEPAVGWIAHAVSAKELGGCSEYRRKLSGGHLFHRTVSRASRSRGMGVFLSIRLWGHRCKSRPSPWQSPFHRGLCLCHRRDRICLMSRAIGSFLGIRLVGYERHVMGVGSGRFIGTDKRG